MKWILVAAAVLLCGCNTFRTTALDRCENDTLIVNPDCPMKGIPVTLRVPTHLELSVVETTYWQKRNIAGAKPTLVALHTARPTRAVTHDVCYTEKVFLVDPARPTAGTQKYGFTFTSNDAGKADEAGKGYLDQVIYKIDDQTITESAKLLANSLNFLSAFPTSSLNPEHVNTGNLISTDRTVAYTRLDINSPSFEHDVAQFLDTNLNCAGCSGTLCPKVATNAICTAP